MSNRTDKLLEKLWHHPLAESVDEYQLALPGTPNYFGPYVDKADTIAPQAEKLRWKKMSRKHL